MEQAPLIPDPKKLDEEKFAAAAQAAMSEWGCASAGEKFFTHSSLLWPVRRGPEKFMLKVANPDDDEAMGAETLKFFGGSGAVCVMQSRDNVQLLEWAGGEGTELEQMVLAGEDDRATHIICDVVEQLHKASRVKSPPVHLIPFRHRSDEMRGHVEEGRVPVEDRPVFRRANDLCDELIAQTADTFTTLHGDIHHFNILQSQRGWLAIDPKGIYGPRVYEYANTLVNPFKHAGVVANKKRMDRQASIIAERAGLDKDLLLQFAFLHAAQCAAWSLYDPDKSYWMACLRTAEELAQA